MRALKAAAVLVAGWALIVLGVLGVMLPLIPGIPFLLAGLALLGSRTPWLRRELEKWLQRVGRLRSGRGSGGSSAPTG